MGRDCLYYPTCALTYEKKQCTLVFTISYIQLYENEPKMFNQSNATKRKKTIP